jgi:hypothetical protein
VRQLVVFQSRELSPVYPAARVGTPADPNTPPKWGAEFAAAEMIHHQANHPSGRFVAWAVWRALSVLPARGHPRLAIGSGRHAAWCSMVQRGRGSGATAGGSCSLPPLNSAFSVSEALAILHHINEYAAPP